MGLVRIAAAILICLVLAEAAHAAPRLQLDATTYFGKEGQAHVIATVTRTGTAGAVSVSYATTDGTALAGSDYTATAGTLNWAAGDNAPKQILVPLLNDAVFEPGEAFRIDLSSAVGIALGRKRATLRLEDNDTGLAFAQSVYTAAEGAPASITVFRRGSLAGAVSIQYATANASALAGSDYTTSTGTLTWANGEGRPKSFPVQLLGDAAAEPLEALKLTLATPTGATLTGPATVNLKIVDDDGVAPATGNPVMFVTQVPTGGFLTVAAAFGSHEPFIHKAPRGGDLMIRYANGTLRNLTQEAGYGMNGFQGANAIAVRQPTIHWSGQKALFSMVVGGNTQQYQTNPVKWQLYEVTGFMPGQTVQITKVAGQPADYNNIAPVYGSDDQVIFISDRPRNGAAHLYPQRDEYESANVDSGLWKLDPATQTFRIIEHAPSGVTYPSIDSSGRVIFTKWDHLLRDQQADQDAFSPPNAYKYGAFNYDSEAQVNPPPVWSIAEHFPELRRAAYSLPWGAGYNGTDIHPDYPYGDLNFNHFFPWMVNQDGSEEETLNHAGRHELGGSYANPSFRNDPALDYITYGEFSGATYFLIGSGGMFHLREDPAQPGMFYGTHAGEFGVNTAGDIVRVYGRSDVNAEDMRTERVIAYTGTGRMRNPLPLKNGALLVVHTQTEAEEQNLGSSTNPTYNYAFRIRGTKLNGGSMKPDGFLTGGIVKSVSWWSPDQMVNWSGTLWELDPVEVMPRTAPRRTGAPALPPQESLVLQEQAVPHLLLRNWLHSQNLAMLVMRDVTTRDRGDKTQPFNLSVPGGVSTIPQAGATVYEVERLQFFQGDQIRGYASGKPPQQGGTPSPGRRVLPVVMHDPAATAANPPVPGGAVGGSVAIAPDGSAAAFVPARRAMAWQLVDGAGTPIVRERNWLSFAPGETRACTSCHGLNKVDQAGEGTPQNKPAALSGLLQNWKAVVRNHCPVNGNSGTWSYTGVAWSACEEGSQYRIQQCTGGGGCCNGMPKTQTQACAP